MLFDRDYERTIQGSRQYPSSSTSVQGLPAEVRTQTHDTNYPRAGPPSAISVLSIQAYGTSSIHGWLVMPMAAPSVRDHPL